MLKLQQFVSHLLKDAVWILRSSCRIIALLSKGKRARDCKRSSLLQLSQKEHFPQAVPLPASTPVVFLQCDVHTLCSRLS